MLHRLIAKSLCIQHLLESVMPLLTGYCRPTSRVQDDVIRIDDIGGVDILFDLMSLCCQRSMYPAVVQHLFQTASSAARPMGFSICPPCEPLERVLAGLLFSLRWKVTCLRWLASPLVVHGCLIEMPSELFQLLPAYRLRHLVL